MIGIYAPFGKMGKALLAYLDEKQMPFTQYDRVNLQTFLDDASVIIDFSTHQATEDLLKILLISSNPLKKLVIGTTGLDEETFLLIEEYSKIAPVFYAQNFSQGITVLKKLIQIAAKALDYDIEIFEAHHALKKDAPSGTALYLGGG